MAPVPGGILFITFSVRRDDDAGSVAKRVAREVGGVSRRYPCGLPFAVGPSRVVIEADDRPIDDDVVRKLAHEVRELLRRVGDELGIADVRVSTD